MKLFEEYKTDRLLRKPDPDFSCLKVSEHDLKKQSEKLLRKMKERPQDFIPHVDEVGLLFREIQFIDEDMYDELKRDEFVKGLAKKFELLEDQIVKTEYANGVAIYVAFYNNRQIEEEFDIAMRENGYFLSYKSEQRFVTYYFYEPLTQANVNDIVFSKDYIYHYTQMNRLEDIMKNGLEPRNERKDFFYLPRVYFSLRENERFITSLKKNLDDSGVKADDEYVLLRVKTEKLKEISNLNFYFDAFVKDAVFIQGGLPEKYIERYKDYSFKNGKLVLLKTY